MNLNSCFSIILFSFDTGTDDEPHEYNKFLVTWGPRFDKIVNLYAQHQTEIEDDDVR